MKKVFSLFDDNGELVKQTEQHGSQLKEGWIVVYKEPLQRLITECKEYSKVRVFIYLSSLQTFDSLVFISIAELSRKLQMTYKTAWSCIKWLEEHEYIKRMERDGITGFLLNPNITTCGKKNAGKKRSMWSSFDLGNGKIVDTETGEIIKKGDLK